MRWLPVPGVPSVDENQHNIIYLTFDDGPEPRVTPAVLELLDLYSAKATFFCLGRNISRNFELFREIRDRGHLVCNHSYSHPKGWFTRTAAYINDVDRAAVFFDNSFFRPPYGKIRMRQYLLLKKKYRLVFWNVLSKDYDVTRSWENCFERVKEKTQPGSLVLFHDSIKASERMLPCLDATLRHFSSLGYVFHSLK